MKCIARVMDPKDGICYMANGRYRFAKCKEEFDETLGKESLVVTLYSELENNVLLHVIKHK